MNELFEWVRSNRHTALGRNLATTALGYAANREHELLRVLGDGRLPLDNTGADRALPKTVVSRNAWMFCGISRSFAKERHCPRPTHRSVLSCWAIRRELVAPWWAVNVWLVGVTIVAFVCRDRSE